MAQPLQASGLAAPDRDAGVGQETTIAVCRPVCCFELREDRVVVEQPVEPVGIPGGGEPGESMAQQGEEGI